MSGISSSEGFSPGPLLRWDHNAPATPPTAPATVTPGPGVRKTTVVPVLAIPALCVSLASPRETKTVVAQVGWEARDDSELQVGAGVTLTVEDVDEIGWAYGRIVGNPESCGWFPVHTVCPDSWTSIMRKPLPSPSFRCSGPPHPTRGRFQGQHGPRLSVVPPPPLPPPVCPKPSPRGEVDSSSVCANREGASEYLRSFLLRRQPASHLQKAGILLEFSVAGPLEAQKRMFRHETTRVLNTLLTSIGSDDQPPSMTSPLTLVQQEATTPKVPTGQEEPSSTDSPPSSVLSEGDAQLKRASISPQPALPLCLPVSVERTAEFNKKPSKAIASMTAAKELDGTPEATAHFLRTCPDLKLELVGDFLSDRDCRPILQAYLDTLDFSHMDFESALRKFLATVALPGEAAKIERMMEAFSARFLRCVNSVPMAAGTRFTTDLFADADSIFLLSFYTVMLNTDLHNHCVKKKRTLREFVRDIAGMNGGRDFNKDFLTELYQQIADCEIQRVGVSAAPIFPYAYKRGWLVQETGVVGTKKRWIVLDDSGLYFFRRPQSALPRHKFDVSRSELVSAPPSKKKRGKLLIVVRTREGDKSAELRLVAEREFSYYAWLESLKYCFLKRVGSSVVVPSYSVASFDSSQSEFSPRASAEVMRRSTTSLGSSALSATNSSTTLPIRRSLDGTASPLPGISDKRGQLSIGSPATVVRSLTTTPTPQPLVTAPSDSASRPGGGSGRSAISPFRSSLQSSPLLTHTGSGDTLRELRTSPASRRLSLPVSQFPRLARPNALLPVAVGSEFVMLLVLREGDHHLLVTAGLPFGTPVFQEVVPPETSPEDAVKRAAVRAAASCCSTLSPLLPLVTILPVHIFVTTAPSASREGIWLSPSSCLTSCAWPVPPPLAQKLCLSLLPVDTP